MSRKEFLKTAAARAGLCLGAPGPGRGSGGAPTAPGELILTDAVVLTVDGGRCCYRSGYVWIRGARILAVGPTSDLKVPPGAPVRRLPGHVILPGLVNCHTHLSNALLRGVYDEMPLAVWFSKGMWPVLQALDAQAGRGGRALAARADGRGRHHDRRRRLRDAQPLAARRGAGGGHALRDPRGGVAHHRGRRGPESFPGDPRGVPREAGVRGRRGQASPPALELRPPHGRARGLGTDGASTNNGQNLWETAKMALLFQKQRLGAAGFGSAELALELLTIGGARALHLEHEIGSLEAGKRANLIVLDAERPPLAPAQTLVSNLVYAADPSAVRSVFVDGEEIVRDGAHLRLPRGEALARGREAATRVLERAGLDSYVAVRGRWRWA